MLIDWQPLLKIVDANERFVITSHVRPDADAIGSEMGLALFLQNRGKQVRVINPSHTPNHLKFLDPTEMIQKMGGEVTVESVCDTDVHIVVDTSAWQQLQDVSPALQKTKAKKIVIDHHLSSDNLGAIEFKDITAAAAGVLVTEFIEASGDSFSPAQAAALFTAIATDTGWYRFPNTDSRTLQAAARLVDRQVEPHAIYRMLYERSSLARLKLHSIVLNRVELASGGRLAHTFVTRADFAATGAQSSDTEDLVNTCLSIDGVEVAFILVEQADGRVKGSLRSRSDISVAAIAEKFGGGGHRQAAGTMLPGPLVTAQQTLLAAFEAAFQERTALPV